MIDIFTYFILKKFKSITWLFYAAKENIWFSKFFLILLLYNALSRPYSAFNTQTVTALKKSTVQNDKRFTIFPTLIHPKSRGTITLQSRDPFDYPVIDPNYLSHPDDLATLIKGNGFV